jgi:hypothetical protein
VAMGSDSDERDFVSWRVPIVPAPANDGASQSLMVRASNQVMR